MFTLGFYQDNFLNKTRRFWWVFLLWARDKSVKCHVIIIKQHKPASLIWQVNNPLWDIVIDKGQMATGCIPFNRVWLESINLKSIKSCQYDSRLIPPTGSHFHFLNYRQSDLKILVDIDFVSFQGYDSGLLQRC